VHNGGLKLFVRLDRFELVDEPEAVAAAADTVECTLGPGTAEERSRATVGKRDARRA
jgi:hypothetical protein